MIHTNQTDPSAPPTVLVIMGSVRAGRLCPKLASWVMGIGQASTGLSYELVDLAEWPLPLDDEPGIPAQGSYDQAHTQAWSRKVGGADAFVFVSPQYNWGYPAVLKNAIDHLCKEWRGKPVMIVTYGGHGGGKCAAQLLQVTDGLKMHPVPTMPGLVLTREMMQGAPVDPERDFQAHVEDIGRAFSEISGLLAR